MKRMVCALALIVALSPALFAQVPTAEGVIKEIHATEDKVRSGDLDLVVEDLQFIISRVQEMIMGGVDGAVKRIFAGWNVEKLDSGQAPTSFFAGGFTVKFQLERNGEIAIFDLIGGSPLIGGISTMLNMPAFAMGSDRSLFRCGRDKGIYDLKQEQAQFPYGKSLVTLSNKDHTIKNPKATLTELTCTFAEKAPVELKGMIEQ